MFLAGSLAGDFLRGRLGDELDADLRAGIVLHRAIDAFADAHPALARSRRRLEPFRHHARIIVDVFYDHYLARHFDRFSKTPLTTFAEATYVQLETVREALPSRLSVMIGRMIEGDWLNSYAEVESIRTALFYLSRRLTRHVALDEAVPLLVQHDAAFEQDFLQFFPQLEAHVRETREREGMSS